MQIAVTSVKTSTILPLTPREVQRTISCETGRATQSPCDSIESTDSIPTDTSSESGHSKTETPLSFKQLNFCEKSTESLVTVLKKSDEVESYVNVCDSESDNSVDHDLTGARSLTLNEIKESAEDITGIASHKTDPEKKSKMYPNSLVSVKSKVEEGLYNTVVGYFACVKLQKKKKKLNLICRF